MIADPSLPEGWAMVPLKELISESQCKAVMEIINGEQDSIQRVRKLTEYLNSIREQLDKKGMDPRFMAYAIENLVLNG